MFNIYKQKNKATQEDFKLKSRSVLMGNCIRCFTGYANNEKIRYNASSGGAITALLIFALENKLIDGAIVAKSSKNNSLLAESFIARTKEEIIIASQSKYCPGVATSLKEVIVSGKFERLAFVGLPCQISGARKVVQTNMEAKKKIVLYLGLFCGGRPDSIGLRFFLEKNNISEEEIEQITYRGGGWPGSVKILKKNGKMMDFSFPLFWNIAGSAFFYPKSCMACEDCTAEVADISFGDPWLKEFRNDKIGHSLIVCRTEGGKIILEEARKAGALKLESILPNKIIQSQMTNIYLKKKGLQPLFSKTIRTGLKPDSLDRILSSIFLFSSTVGRIKLFRKILYFIPLKFVSSYGKFLGKIWHYRAEKTFKKYI